MIQSTSEHGTPTVLAPDDLPQEEYGQSQEEEGPGDNISVLSTPPSSPENSGEGSDADFEDEDDNEWNVRDTLQELAAQAAWRLEERRASLSHQLSTSLFIIDQ